MNLSEQVKRWLRSLAISLVIFILLSLYLVARRGYYNLYIANKVFGSTAAVIAAVTLFIGPLSRRFPHFTRFMTIRRQLGLVAFGLAITHVITSLIQKERFAFPSWYVSELVPVLFGLVAIVIWAYMVYISRNKKIVQMGAEVWKRRLSLAGNVSFLAIFLHLVIMKYEGWLRWLKGAVKASPELANPSYPPASLFVFFTMLAVLVYRIVNTLFRKKEVNHDNTQSNYT